MKKVLLFIVGLLNATLLLANQLKGESVFLPSQDLLGNTNDIPIKLYGFVNNSTPPAIYSFNASPTVELEKIHTDSRFTTLSTGVYAEEKYYVFTPEYNYVGLSRLKYTVFNVNDWEVLLDKDLETSNIDPHLMTFDPISKKIYGYKNNNFYELDKETGVMSLLFTIDSSSFNFLITNPYGITYGLDRKTGKLQTINMQTHEVETVGDVANSQGLNNLQSATIDYQSGRCFWAYIDNWDNKKNKLVEINLEDASTKDIASFPNSEVFRGALFTRSKLSVKDALIPDIIENLEIIYKVPGENNATFKLIAPSKTFDKKSMLQEALTITFFVDNVEVGSKDDVTPGGEVNYNYTLTSGIHWISAIATNSKGSSPQVQAKTFAGFDTPAAVNDIVFKVNTDGKYSVTWNAPSKWGVNNGLIDIQNMKYILTQYPDNTILSNDITETSYIGTFATTELKNYYFGVTALCGDKKGEEAFSNHSIYGESVNLPFAENFQSSENWELHTIIDENEDQNTWKYNSEGNKCAIYIGNVNQATDWMFTPAIKMRKDITYTMTFTYLTPFGMVNNLTIWCSKGMNTYQLPNENMVSLGDISDDPTMVNTEKSVTYTPEEDGIYHFAFQCYSSPKQTLYLWNYNIVASAAPDAPAEVEELKIVPAELGKLEATITFKAPTLTMSGDPLTDEDITSIVIYRGQSLDIVKTFSTPQKGQSYSFIDTKAVQGINEYRVVTYNRKGNSGGISAKGWIGEDLAKPVPNFKVTLTDEDVIFTWEKPIGGYNNGYINYENITYTIFYYISNLFEDYYPLVSDLTETTYRISKTKFDSFVNNSQISLSFALVAITSASGSGYPAYFDMIYGTPYLLPFAESFANSDFATEPWGVIVLNGDIAWNRVDNSPVSSVRPYDNDGGMAMFYQKKAENSEGRLLSPEISIKGAENPELSFYMFHRSTSDNENNYLQIEIKKGDGEYIAIGERIPVNDGNTGWKEHKALLKDLGTEQFRLSFCGKADVNVDFYIDNIRVAEQKVPIEYPRVTDLQGKVMDKDMKAELTWSAPTEIGDLSLLGYYVYCDGKKITKDYIPECTYTVELADFDPHVFAVSVVYNEGDSKLSNEIKLQLTPSNISSHSLNNVNVYVSQNIICLEGENASFHIYTITGEEIHAGQINGLQMIKVTTGIYFVKVGNQIFKCVIR